MAGPDPTGRISRPTEFIRGLSWKRSADMASTGDLTLSGVQTIDGASGAEGKRVLAKDQAAGAENGLWIMRSGAWTRAFDMDQDSSVRGVMADEEIAGSFVYVFAGTVNAGKMFHTTNLPGDTLEVDDVVWEEWGAASSDPALDTAAWMPLTTVVGGVPELVWDGDDSLIPTLTPI